MLEPQDQHIILSRENTAGPGPTGGRDRPIIDIPIHFSNPPGRGGTTNPYWALIHKYSGILLRILGVDTVYTVVVLFCFYGVAQVTQLRVS